MPKTVGTYAERAERTRQMLRSEPRLGGEEIPDTLTEYLMLLAYHLGVNVQFRPELDLLRQRTSKKYDGKFATLHQIYHVI